MIYFVFGKNSSMVIDFVFLHAFLGQYEGSCSD